MLNSANTPMGVLALIV